MPPSSEGDFPGGLLLTRRGSRGSPETCKASRLPFFIFIIFLATMDLFFSIVPPWRILERWLCSSPTTTRSGRLWAPEGWLRGGGQMAFPGFTGLVSWVGERDGEVLSMRSASPSLDLKTRPQTCAPALPPGRRRLLQHHGGTWRCLSFPAGEVLSPACPPQIPQGS